MDKITEWIIENWQIVVTLISLGVALYAIRCSIVMERRIGKVLALSIFSNKHSFCSVIEGGEEKTKDLSRVCHEMLDDPDIKRFLPKDV